MSAPAVVRAVRAFILVALLALLLGPTALALPLDSRVEGATLVVELGEGLPTNVTVIVTHVDERPWVDRVAQVTRTGPSNTLRLDGLPRDVAFDVRVFDGAQPLPTLASAPAYLDAGAIHALAPLASMPVGPIPSGGSGASLPVITKEVAPGAARHLYTTASGRIALLQLAENSSLILHVSEDGGRTFRGPRTIALGQGGEPQFIAGVAGETLSIVYRHLRWVDDPSDFEPAYTSQDHWRYVRVDLATLVDVATRTLTLGSRSFSSLNGDMVPGPDGSLLTFYSGSLIELDAQGRATNVGSHTDDVEILRINADGTVVSLGDVPGARYSQYLRATVGPDGTIAVLGASHGPPGASLVAWVSTSPGASPASATFTRARNISASIIPAQGHQVYTHSIAMDADRNVHACMVAGRLDVQPVAFDAYYVRAAPDGTSIGRNLRAASPTPAAADHSMSTCLVAATQRTVWLTWSSNSDGSGRWLQRSADAGASWGAPLALRQATEPHTIEMYGERPLALLPDGRPVFQGGGSMTLLGFPFEPRQPPASRLDRMSVPTPASAPPPREPVEILAIEPREILIPLGGEARIELRLRSTSPVARVVELTASADGAPLVIHPAAIEIGAGETLILSGTLALGEPRPSGSAIARVWATPEGVEPASGQEVLVRWEGEGPRPIAPPSPPGQPILTHEPPARPPAPTRAEAPVPGAPLALIVLGAILLARLRRP